MDQMKTGRFIAALRKERNLTQEQLGEKLGVTNKTISRWENGNYMPDVEMLLLLSKEFGVSINELISGERQIRRAPVSPAPVSCLGVSLSTPRICPCTGRFDAEKRRRFILVGNFGENLRNFA